MNHYRAISAAIAAALCFAAIPETASAAGRANLSGLASGTTFDQFIVKYRDGTPERGDVAAINSGLARAAQMAVPRASRAPLLARHFRRMSLGADVIRVDRKLDRVDAETLMRQIAADPNVEYVEIDARMYPTVLPNDPRFPEQWHYFNTPAGVNLPNAWDKSTGSGVVVAVIDTGITPHSDLGANIVAGYDFITNTFISRDGNGRDANPNDEGDWSPVANECYAGSPVTNSSWHGTHVAGTVAAVTNNAVGVAGVAYGARVQPVRALGRCGGVTSDIADGIVWASGGAVSGVPANATPARIINMSLGGGGACSTTYQNAINGAVGRGTTVVVAAGNDNINASGVQPASCGNVIAVGATDSNGVRASFSNYGAAVDIAAPGVGILSTLNSGAQTQSAEAYAFYNGTSMASPHVAGVAALVQSRRVAAGLGAFTPAQLESHLKSNARAFPSTPSQPIGTGIVNADAAVTAAGVQHGSVPDDTNGDGRSDIIWRKAATNQVAYWQMNAASVSGYVFGTGLAGYAIAATGDADGDGRTDVLWDNGGTLMLWTNTGSGFTTSQVASYGDGWKMASMADVNGDGRADIIWIQPQLSQVATWFMNGSVVSGYGFQPALAGYALIGAGDFNGDKKFDLLWDNGGTLNLWVSTGTAFTSTQIANYGDGWKPEVAADVNGDGKMDIVWRQQAQNQVAYWFMNGPTIVGTGFRSGLAGYSILGSGDFNGDGRSDLLWDNGGTLYVWLSTGTDFTSSLVASYGDGWLPWRNALKHQ